MAKKKNSVIKEWLKMELSPYYPSIGMVAVLNVIVTVLSLVFAYLVRYLINSAAQNDKELLFFFAIILLSIIVLRILFQTFSSYLAEKCCIKITVELRQSIFQRILHSNYREIEKHHSGDYLTRLTADVGEVAGDTVTILPAILGIAVQIAGAIAALLTLDVIFTLIFIAGAVLVVLMTVFFRKKLKLCHKEAVKADSDSRSFIQESLASSLTIKAYNAEDKILRESRGFLAAYYKKRMKRNRLRAFMGGTFSLLSNAAFIFALVWCGIGIMQDKIDYGSMVSIILLLGQLKQPVTSFSGIMPLYYARQASAERLFEIAMFSKQTQKKGASISYEEVRGIVLKNLTFNYGLKNVFLSASARIEKGKIICITGDSASGKSTLFKLLLNVYGDYRGEIYFQKEDEKIPLSAVDRTLFAYVPQGNFLFSGTIRDNLISFCDKDDIQDLNEKIDTALRVACSEFVNDLPKGLDTYLCERGGGLSEGQLQRLAIARSLVSDRPIILLDEATSALDEDTERQLLNNLKEIDGKTILIITHRPAALKICDKILHIEQGRIIEKLRGNNDNEINDR